MTKFSKDKALRLHQYIASEAGGSIGLRDEGLLESALESAFAAFLVFKWPCENAQFAK